MPCRSLAAFMCLFALAVSTLACSATRGSPTGAGGGGASGTGSTTTSSGQGGSGGIGVEADGGLPTGLRYTGTVWGPHPDGKPALFPVPGALVFASKDPPGAIPACNACVKLPLGAQYAISGPDGSFQLDVTPGASFHLIVEKGQFRRVTPVSAPDATGIQQLGEVFTTLPNHTDLPNGDTVPRMALVYGDYDHIEDVLAKVGMGMEDGAFGHQWGSEAGFFDVYDNSGPSEPKHGQNLAALLKDPQKLASYDVILFSCSYNANFSFMADPVVQKNLRDFVWNGGKLYVSDYAMPVVEMAWNEFIWFTDPVHGGCTENQFPPNCNHGPPFDSPAASPDPGLSDWLKAMGGARWAGGEGELGHHRRARREQGGCRSDDHDSPLRQAQGVDGGALGLYRQGFDGSRDRPGGLGQVASSADGGLSLQLWSGAVYHLSHRRWDGGGQTPWAPATGDDPLLSADGADGLSGGADRQVSLPAREAQAAAAGRPCSSRRGRITSRTVS